MFSGIKPGGTSDWGGYWSYWGYRCCFTYVTCEFSDRSRNQHDLGLGLSYKWITQHCTDGVQDLTNGEDDDFSFWAVAPGNDIISVGALLYNGLLDRPWLSEACHSIPSAQFTGTTASQVVLAGCQRSLRYISHCYLRRVILEWYLWATNLTLLLSTPLSEKLMRVMMVDMNTSSS